MSELAIDRTRPQQRVRGGTRNADTMPVYPPAIEPPHAPVMRRHWEDAAAILFSCPICNELRVDVYALAARLDSYVVCPKGTIRGCDTCGGARIVP